MLELLREGTAPAAILLGEADAILPLGVVVGRELGYEGVPIVELPVHALDGWANGEEVEVREDGSVGEGRTFAPTWGDGLAVDQDGNVYVAEPLFGEGIYYAVASGQAAARAVLAQRADERADDRYGRLRAPLDRDLRGWTALAGMFDAYPRATYRVVCSALSRRVIMRSTALGWTLSETLWRLPALPFARARRPAALG